MNVRTVMVAGLLPGLLALSCNGPASRIGQVCQQDQHCGGEEEGLTLSCDFQTPGGSCTVTDCTPDDPDTLDVAEDEQSCPAGSRCVREKNPLSYRCKGATETRLVCRPECGQRGDCPEVIVCSQKCTSDDNGNETCQEVCENRMECVPFWSHLPDANLSAEAAAAAENPPRACVLYGSDCVFQQEQD